MTRRRRLKKRSFVFCCRLGVVYKSASLIFTTASFSTVESADLFEEMGGVEIESFETARSSIMTHDSYCVCRGYGSYSCHISDSSRRGLINRADLLLRCLVVYAMPAMTVYVNHDADATLTHCACQVCGRLCTKQEYYLGCNECCYLTCKVCINEQNKNCKCGANLWEQQPSRNEQCSACSSAILLWGHWCSDCDAGLRAIRARYFRFKR